MDEYVVNKHAVNDCAEDLQRPQLVPRLLGQW